jgi:hypothetical protein
MAILNVGGGAGNYATIALALAAAAASGDTIKIPDGTYTETLTISKSVTIEGTSKAGTIITGAGSTITITANNVTLQNLTVHTSGYNQNIVGILGAISGTTLENVKLTSTSASTNSGLFLNNNDSSFTQGFVLSNVTVTNCEFENSAYGVKTSDGARTDNVKLITTTFTNHSGYGILSFVPNNFITPINSLYKEVGNINWDISGCIFTNIGVTNENYTGPIFLEQFGKSKIRNCIFNGWNSIPYNTFNTAFVQLSIKRASSSQAGFNTYNGEDIEITGNTLIGSRVAGTTTTSTRSVGLFIQGRNDGTTYSRNPGLIKNMTITNNTFKYIGTGIRFSNNIDENSMIIDGNHFSNPEVTDPVTGAGPATGATFRRTDISVSGSTFTLNNHGYVAGEMVHFGASIMPGDLNSNDYFVIGTPTQNTFQVSTTVEGSAVSTSSAGTGLFVDGPTISFGPSRKTGVVINTTATLLAENHGLVLGASIVFGSETRQLPNPISITGVDTVLDTFTTSVDHGFAQGAAVRLSAALISSGLALPGALNAGTIYFVIKVSNTIFKLSTAAPPVTEGTGTAINITSAGSNVVVFSNSVGIASGVTYYVSEVINSNAFRIAMSHSQTGNGFGTVPHLTMTASALTVYFDRGHGLHSSDGIQIVGGTTAPGISTGTYYVQSIPNASVFKISSTLGGTALTPTSIGAASSFSFTNNRYIDASFSEPEPSQPINVIYNSSVTLATARTVTLTGNRSVTFNAVSRTASAITGDRTSSKFRRTVTSIDIGTDTLTSGAHGYTTGDIVTVGGTAVPGGLNTTTQYYVINTGVNTFKLAATYADAIATTPVINITSAGTSPFVEGFKRTVASVTALDLLTSNAHGLNNGDRVILSSTGTFPAGLNAGVYFIINRATNTFSLSATFGGTAIDITGITFTGILSVESLSATFRKPVSVTFASDLLTTTAPHGYITGDVVRVGAATFPTGLDSSTLYYVIYDSATTFKLATSSANATAGTAIDITSAGVGVCVEGPCLSLTAHGYSVDDTITINGVGVLAPGIPAGTYYVKSVRDANNFTISATQGGDVIIPSDSTSPFSNFTINGPAIITTSAAHGYSVGSIVGFSGTLPTGLSAGTLYYVKSAPTTTTFQVSATNGGVAVNTSGAAGSGSVHIGTIGLTAHTYETGDDVTFPAGTTPGVAAGTYKVIYVDANNFRIGATINTPIMPAAAGSSVFVSGPCIVTLTNHGFSLNNPVSFTNSGGALPTGITAGTTYYMRPLATPNTGIFQLASSVDGSKLITSGTASGTQTVNSALIVSVTNHGYVNNDTIYFNTAGSLPVGINIYPTLYYVINATANTFQIASTQGGNAIVTTGSGTTSLSGYNLNLNGQINISPDTISLNDHGYDDGDIIYFTTTGVLPGGLTASVSYATYPTLYYVVEGTADTFKVAAVSSGTAITLTDRGTGTHKIYKVFALDAKQCYFDVISSTKVISDSSITDTQRYSLIKSVAISDNRIIMAATSTGVPTTLVPITPAALFNAPVDKPLVIVGDNATYENSASELVTAGSADLSTLTGMSVSNLPEDSFKVVAGVKNITAEDLNFTIKVFDAAGTAITTFNEPIVIEIYADYPYTLKTANVLLNGVTIVAEATYDPETKKWSFTLDANSEYSLDATAPCLVEGTKVLTASGYVNVEDLKAGTRIVTGDKRSVEVVKVHSTKYNRTTSITSPYIIEKDAFGVNYPQQQIKISGRHTIQLKSGLWEVPSEAARSNNGKVRQVPIGSSVQYYHVELPDYEKDTMIADGLIVESYNNGNYDESYTWNAAKQGYERKVVRKF